MEDTSELSLSPSRKWTIVSAAGAVLAAVGASLCCIGPLAFAVLGIGGGGLLGEVVGWPPPFFLGARGVFGVGVFFSLPAPPVAADGRRRGGGVVVQPPGKR